MICFCIALRSQYSTKNWGEVLKNFNNTLHSIFNQTNKNFMVYVACNEIPELFDEYDERLHFIIANTPLPNSWEEGCRDRSWKLLLCAQEIRKNYDSLIRNTPLTQTKKEGLYVFPVDADDYVNCNIAQYCFDHPNENGFKSKKGYKWVNNSRYFEITKYYGGTMNIMKMYKDDLPEDMPDISLCFEKEIAMHLTKRFPIRWYDIEVEKKYSEMGRPLSVLPFKSTVYVLGRGDNLSSNDPSFSQDKKRFHPIAMLRKIYPFNKKLITNKIKQEFGIL